MNIRIQSGMINTLFNKYIIFCLKVFLIILVTLILSCKKNQAPFAPEKPGGPSIGTIDTTYYFSASVIDPDNDSVSIRFDWGDGVTSDWSPLFENEELIFMPHSWSYPDNYYIQVQAKDDQEMISEWSLPCSIRIKLILNQSPNPSLPYGPLTGFIQTSYQFSSFAIDPDNDSVSIRFDWGDGNISDWSAWLPSGDSVWLSHSWFYPDTYYVRTQVKDIFGATSNSSLPISVEIINPTSGLVWICATPSAGWSPRDDHTSVVFDNKMWVMGGWTGAPPYPLNDVWYSSDGINWICATEAAGWLPRASHTSVVFDNKIWVIGGWNNAGRINDVWCSSDGVNWTCVIDSAGWSTRCNHASVIFENKIWILGPGNDVWNSTDGVNWECVTEHAQWKERSSHTSVVFDNKIWVMGGVVDAYSNCINDVWYSTNGTDWVRATIWAGWLPRHSHASVVFDNKIWVIGGRGGGNDIWFSTDGEFWIREFPSTIFTERYNHTALVFDNKIWILGGYCQLSDVWYRDIVKGK